MLLCMSMSTPDVSARRPASDGEPATPWLISSATDVQSLTTNPENFHSRRSTVSVSQAFPDAGTPATSLNADMRLATPASTAALNGGRYTSRIVRSEISVSLYSRPASAAP